MKRITWGRAAAIGVCASIVPAVPAVAAHPSAPADGGAITYHGAYRSLPGDRPSSDSTAAAATPAPDDTAKPSQGVTPEEIRKAQEAERYWTPERIRAAVPVDAVRDAGKLPDGQRRAGAAAGNRSSAQPSHPANAGVATVGVFLIRNDDGSPTPNQFCTASAVTSSTKSLVLTAAHCLKSDRPPRNVAFVPGYRTGASQAGESGETPYGIFPMEQGKVWIDSRYLAKTPSDDVDFAFLRVGPNSQGQLLEDAVGRGNSLTSVPATQLARRDVTVIGYPGGQKTPLQCTNDTKAFQGRFMEITCAGYRSGVSGGPFLESFDGSRGNLVGAIGGYKTGGVSDDVSYTSQFDNDVFRLYHQAVDDAAPDTVNPLGSASTWQHATGLTTGRFHTDSVRIGTGDLIVRWSDGEVSLYPGNRRYGFAKDIQLAKKDGPWKQAKAVTAGEFTGNTTDDLLVRWANGTLTLYKDVNETNKLTQAVQLKGPNDTWTHASGLTAGRFGGGNTRRDDLVVRWSDGEVTLYTNVDGKGLHAEKRLEKRNTTWPHARDIAAGNFATESGDQDLFVAWSDGEVTVYENTGAKGLTAAAERRLRPAKSAWRNTSLVVSGAFGGGTRQDDLIARWPGGQLVMYGDTTTKSLGRENVLVPPQIS
ncbi:trypsin-like serine peptidase [Streptomyces sp. NRRL S-1813]|uniref:trypsin-like serine peptidase n=1 Tax=Streptomyces sp. NRRL S-1813 TaxID=1463888 RepID=UPI000D13F8CC|nr:trypsin-like peptidase domain-containing protein [Streptomyces sp. NRRL S-1813]